MLSALGASLRFPHFDEWLQACNKAADSTFIPSWFEVMVEDFLEEGPHHQKLEQLCEVHNKSIVFHSTGLNVGGTGHFDPEYISSLNELFQKYHPVVVSDHLCWSASSDRYHHDLLPIPPTYEALRHTVSRVMELQDYFQRELCLENITTYIDYTKRDMTDLTFLCELVKQTGCSLLLDISNASINHKNRRKDSRSFFAAFPMNHVRYMHLSGGDWDAHLNTMIDSHSSSPNQHDLKVLEDIYHKRPNSPPVVLEWDSELPSFCQMQKEHERISRCLKS